MIEDYFLSIDNKQYLFKKMIEICWIYSMIEEFIVLMNNTDH